MTITSTDQRQVYQQPPPPPRKWWNPVVLYPTVTHIIPLMLTLYAATNAPYPDAFAFLCYTLGVEWYIGNVFLYLTFEPTLLPSTKRNEKLYYTTVDMILTLYESMWILLLDTYSSVVNGYIAMGSMIVLMFIEKLLADYPDTDWRTVWYIAGACRRAFVMGYLVSASLPTF